MNALQLVMIFVAVAVFGTMLIYIFGDLSDNNLPSVNSSVYKPAETNKTFMSTLAQLMPYIILVIGLFIVFYLLLRVLG